MTLTKPDTDLSGAAILAEMQEFELKDLIEAYRALYAWHKELTIENANLRQQITDLKKELETGSMVGTNPRFEELKALRHENEALREVVEAAKQMNKQFNPLNLKWGHASFEKLSDALRRLEQR